MRLDASAQPDKTRRRLLKTMLLIRLFEKKIIDVYPEQEMKSPVHLCIGEEAIAAGVCEHLRDEDYLFSTHRSHGHCLAKGASPESLYAEFYGKATGCCKGKGGSMHPAFPQIGILGTTAIVGGGLPLAVGAALASVLLNTDRVSVAFFGDGASEEGSFHESLNFAALKNLPVVFVCENNYYATSSPLAARQPNLDIYRRAGGYDIPGFQVDGNDVEAVWEASGAAIDRARRGDGPTLIECRTYRWRGHVGPECDWEKGCRPQAELMEWMERCPIKAYGQMLIQAGVIDDCWYTDCRSKISTHLDEALQAAKMAAFPKPDDLYKHLFHGS